MDSHVLIKVAPLCERLTAAKDRAHKRFLLCVRPQVVKEIVPFLEASLAVLEFTNEDLSPSFALRFEVLNVFEGPQIWNM
jgi:hypothetical protein